MSHTDSGMNPTVELLIHLTAVAGIRPQAAGPLREVRMTSAFGPGGPGSGPFDDFLARFLGGASPRGG